MPCVYLLHVDPSWRGRSHYIGFTNSSHPASRVARHKAGRGGTYTSRLVRAGHNLKLAVFWPGADENFERWLKEQRNTKLWCPCCGINELAIPTIDEMPKDYNRFEALKRRKGAREVEEERRVDAMLERYYSR